MKDITIERTAPTGLADAVRCKAIDFGLAACCATADEYNAARPDPIHLSELDDGSFAAIKALLSEEAAHDEWVPTSAVSDLLRYEFDEDYADQQVSLMSPKAGTLIPDPE